MDNPPKAPRNIKAFWQQLLDLPTAYLALLIVSAAGLIYLGVLEVMSASSVYAEVHLRGDAYYYVKRQIGFLVVGLVSIVAIWFMPIKWVKKTSLGMMFFAWILLLLIFIPGVGVEINGNRNWLNLPLGFRFQPSEVAKLALVLTAATFFVRREKQTQAPGRALFPYLPVAVITIVLVVAGKDLGTALVLGAIVMTMLYISGLPRRAWWSLIGFGSIVVAILIKQNSNRISRFLGFLNPDQDVLGVNQQPLRGIYALASGGWWGVGIGGSKQKWGLLAESHTDYIFAILGEELGLVGVITVIILFTVMAFAGYQVALKSDDSWCRYVAAGITSWFMIQALGNIMVVLRMGPVIGIPLPFMSYGGSALFSCMLGLGYLLACAKHNPQVRKWLATNKRNSSIASSVVVNRRER